MTLEEAIENILDGQAVLFAGSGFSYGAMNGQGQVPSAKQLKRDLLADLKMDVDSDYSLETVAEYYKKEKSAEELINMLKYQYNIKQVAEHHKSIMNVYWKRVYTTNYDQVIEKASRENQQECWKDAVILSDDFSATNKRSACIHINGYIERVNIETLNEEFKLTDSSYSASTLVDNPWFQFMVNDFKSASAIIVIGYSMQFDIDIKRLFSSPEIFKKVIFIDAENIDELSKSLLENYGTCYPIGIENFSERLNSAKKDFIPSLNFTYKNFREAYHDTQTSINPTYEEIVKFYTEGRNCEQMYGRDSSGSYKYIIDREAMNSFLRNYRYKKVSIALSNLGNGKSVFLKIAENELMSENVKVYTYVDTYDSLDEEIERICAESKLCIVIIDNYPGHMEILEKFAQYDLHNVRFLLSARNGVNNSFCKKLERTLHISEEDIYPLHLNQLQDQEIKDIVNVLLDNSLLTNINDIPSAYNELYYFIRNTCKARFANLLLKIFEASSIRKKLEKLYKDLEESPHSKAKEVAIFALLKNISNYELSFTELLDLFEADYIELVQDDIEFISEIFSVDNDGGLINVRSSIISSWLVKNIIKMKDIIDVMETAFLAADKKSGRVYEELQKAMVSHSQFLLFRDSIEDSATINLIGEFYDDIRNTKFAKHNTFFWEQFASAYLDMKNFDMAKQCIGNAFNEAKRNPGFVPFQVENVLGRYYVEKCIYDITCGKCDTTEAVDAIRNAKTAILKYYNHPENNVYYAFRVAHRFSDIYNMVKDSMSNRERSMYIEDVTAMCEHMNEYLKYEAGSQYFNDIDLWMKNLLETKEDAQKRMRDDI